MDVFVAMAFFIAVIVLLLVAAGILRKAERALDEAEHALAMNRLTEAHIGRQIANLTDILERIKGERP